MAAMHQARHYVFGLVLFPPYECADLLNSKNLKSAGMKKKKKKKNLYLLCYRQAPGMHRARPAHKKSIHTKLFESHLPPVTHTKHAGRHGFQGNQEAPFLDNGSRCRDGGH